MKTEIKLTSISCKAPEGTDQVWIKNKTGKLLTKLRNLQDVLYAEHKRSVLIVLQGMDAAGKDGIVNKVFSDAKINPSCCAVFQFKAPTAVESARDFLWRVHPNVPPHGHIHIFNRSHYEDILVPTVHNLFDKKTVDKRYEQINDFERLLKDNGTVILKFFLHLSEKEQSHRFSARMADPQKRWKYNSRDLLESKHWNKYMDTYEKIFEKSEIKWTIVPADDKWYRNYVVLKKIVKEMEKLKMKFPKAVMK